MEAIDKAEQLLIDDESSSDDSGSPLAPGNALAVRGAELIHAGRGFVGMGEAVVGEVVRSERGGIRSSFGDFVTNLELRLSFLQSGRGTDTERAREILMILRQILVREVGVSALDEGLPILCARFGEVGAIPDLFKALARDARDAMRKSYHGGTSIERLLHDLEFLLTWYIRRKQSLLQLERESYADELRDLIFNLRVIHDQEWAGIPGCELRTGVWLMSRAGQRLWLKAFVRAGGELVNVRDGWRAWVDETEASPLARQRVRGKVASVRPLFPRGQRQLVDSATLFIPYEALDLSPGRHEVEFVVRLCDDVGTVSCELSRFEMIAVPESAETPEPKLKDGRSEGFAVISAPDRPSPQALGLWATEASEGTRIIETRVRTVLRENGEAPEEIIEVSADAEVYGHVGEGMTAELRVLRADGTTVSAASGPTASNPHGEFCEKIELQIRRPISRFENLRFLVPTRALSLDKGPHSLLIEVAILASDRQVICGTLTPLRCEITVVPPLSSDQAQNASPVSTSPGTETRIAVSHLHVSTGIHPRSDVCRSIRAEIELRSDFWNEEFVRVLFSLETTDGLALCRAADRLPLQRMVAIGGGWDESTLRRAVVHFEEREVLRAWADALARSMSSGSNESPVVHGSPLLLDARPVPRLVLKATVLSRSDEVVAEIKKASLPLPGSSSAIPALAPDHKNGTGEDASVARGDSAGGAGDGVKRVEDGKIKFVKAGGESVSVADILIRPRLLDRALECVFTLELNGSSEKVTRSTLYLDVVGPQGRTLLGCPPSYPGLPGMAQVLNFTQLAPLLRSVNGAFQIQTTVLLPLSLGQDTVGALRGTGAHEGGILRSVLLSVEEKVLQTLRRSVDVAVFVRVTDDLRDKSSSTFRNESRTSAGRPEPESPARSSISGRVSRFLFGPV